MTVRHALLALLTLCLPWTVAAQTAQQVQFPGATGAGFPVTGTVSAWLRKPTQPAAARWPAVVVLHGSGGMDGRGEFHSAALTKAGFATLEVYMFDRNQRPREGHATTFTHAYGALKYLAAQPDIDPGAIGVLGFSWGGNMSLRMSSAAIREAFAADIGSLNFAAHASFYPQCWLHDSFASRESPDLKSTYAAFTGAPVLIFAGGKDDYDAPDDCQRFIDNVAVASKAQVRLTFYPDATHGWDVPGNASRTVFDPSAHRGKGGQVRMLADRAIAEQSRTDMVSFFSRHLLRR